MIKSRLETINYVRNYIYYNSFSEHWYYNHFSYQYDTIYIHSIRTEKAKDSIYLPCMKEGIFIKLDL